MSALRVLVVDDNPLDAELELRELRRARLALEPHVATNEGEFRRALDEFAPDVILCDFSFPGFDGLRALAIAGERAPGIPVIFVTGTIGEDRAVLAVRNGAADYVLKRNLLRLPDAVNRAVAEAREKAHACALETELAVERERMTALLDNIDSAFSSYSVREGSYLYLSRGVEQVYGRPPEAFVRDPDIWNEFVHPDDLERFLADRERLLREGSIEIEYRVVHPDGRVRWLNHRSKLARDADGTPSRIDTIATDVTARIEQQRALERLSRVRDVFAAVNAAIVRVTEPARLCQETCRIAHALGGFALSAVVTIDRESRAATLEATIGEYPFEISEQRVREAFDDGDASSVVAASLRLDRPVVDNDIGGAESAVADPAVLLASGVHAFGSFPFVIGASRRGLLLLGAPEAGFFSEDEIELITAVSSSLGFALELAEKRERLNYLAYYDPLTELPNRTLAIERLDQEIAAAQRREDRLAVIAFDVRQFSNFNTTLGVAAGDHLLRLLAQRLREKAGATRVARIAGDRFTIFIPELRAIREVTTALGAEGLNLLAEPFMLGGEAFTLAAHVGVAVYPTDGTDAPTLLRNAETALQNAKLSEAAYRFYSPELNERMQRRLVLETRLRRAAAEHEFVLYYQPKVDLRTREICGVEALIRWNDPVRPNAPVLPGEFIPVLEETGLMHEVGRWVITEAVRQHREWSAAGLQSPRIAVNVSAPQLAQRHLVDDISEALRGLPEPGLDVEVTESGLMSNVGEAIETLRRIRELGVEIALDDFGTGYSSLSYISQLPITTMKIDRSFIHGMTTNPDKLTIITTVISLGRELKLRVVAEGVETEEQANLLGLLRCDQIQGFLIARPMPAGDLALLLPPAVSA